MTASVHAEVQFKYPFAIVLFQEIQKFPHIHVIIAPLALLNVEGNLIELGELAAEIALNLSGFVC